MIDPRGVARHLPAVGIGIAGALIAVVVRLPIPWMLGALFACAAATVAGWPVRALPNVVERWMRVAIGVSLGPYVAASLTRSGEHLPLAIAAAVGIVTLSVALGTRWFARRGPLPRPAAFLTALPGGLSMLLAMAGDIGNRAQVLMAHTVRVVFVVVSISLLARALGIPPVTAPFADSLQLTSAASPWLLVALIVGGFLLAERLRIAGGHVLFPMILTALLAGLTDWSLDTPPIVKTVALLTFGIVLGCEVAGGPRESYGRLFRASILFTVAFMAAAAGLALGLDAATGLGFLVLFLALAPGGIAEVSLVALALGLDAGLVALVHACRFLYIILAGPVGLALLTRRDAGAGDDRRGDRNGDG